MTETRAGRRAAGIRRPRRWTKRRILLAALLVVFVGLPVVGWVCEQYATKRDARRFPPPGQFVDIGGRRLHYVCSGSGGPLVLFEVSGFSNSMSFADARAGLAQHTRVCSYDRMGIGWSDPGPSSIPVSLLADDLRQLLDVLEPRDRVVLVASSIGGLTAELFARRHPHRLAGLVFLDAGNSEAVSRLPERDIRFVTRPGCRAVQFASAISLMRLVDPWRLRRTEESARSAALMYGSKPWIMLCSMVRAGMTTVREFAEANPAEAGLHSVGNPADAGLYTVGNPAEAGLYIVTRGPTEWVIDVVGPLGPLVASLATLPVADLHVAPFALEKTVLDLMEGGRP